MTRRLDKATNSIFGHTIDSALDDGLHSARLPLDARNTDGKPARPLTGVAGADGKTYTIKSGGLAIPKGTILFTTRADGTIRFNFSPTG